MVRGFLGVTMKILNHGAMTGSAVRDFPELTLAAAFREAGTDYGHGSYAAYGKRVLDFVLVLFAVAHLVGNSTIWFGSGWINAYAEHLHGLLVDRQPLADEQLTELAAARANNARDAIVASNPELEARVEIIESITVSRDDDEPVRMRMTLTTRAVAGDQ